MNILDQILEVKKQEVIELKNKFTLSSFSDYEFFNSKCLKFKDKLSGKSLSIIAEIKKASPSKGIIREDFNHQKIAEIYFSSGVDAVSILTDNKFFCGSINYLNNIAKMKERPLLRKDFIISEYQVYEAKANGADIILLICEALSQSQINELTSAAYEIGLEVLLELHSEQQLSKISFTLNDLIGINNRNLETFEVSLDTTAKLAGIILNQYEKTKIISESGISTGEDISFLKNQNINGILVGEHLMKSADIKSKIEELKEWCSNEG